MLEFAKGDILNFEGDLLVSPSNDAGLMGGLFCRYLCFFPNLPKQINKRTKGIVEKESKEFCSKNSVKSGDVFTTSANCLPYRYILHAITVDNYNKNCNISIIKNLCEKIIEKARELNCKTVVIPLLGIGEEKLNRDYVHNLYVNYFFEVPDIKFIVVEKED